MIRVSTGARLHLGFYNIATEDGHAYGGVGVAIDRPRVVVEVEPSHTLVVENRSTEPIDDVVDNVVKSLDVSTVRIRVLECIPRHVGLGSTTQLSLALATAISILRGWSEDPYRLAQLVGRGFVSGIGVASFTYGGFVIDGGTTMDKLKHGAGSYVPRPIVRVPFPEEWRFVLLIPFDKRGLSEEEEREILTKVEIPPLELRYEMLRYVFLGMLRAVVMRDHVLFAKSLDRLQIAVGRYFAKFQGGIFVSQHLVEALRSMGIEGVGQSSWGPTIYGFVENEERAQNVASRIRSMVSRVNVLVVKPRNRGYEIVKK